MEETVHMTPAAELDKIGYVNQHGLSRKVWMLSDSSPSPVAVVYDALHL
jgi:hypothetical protein